MAARREIRGVKPELLADLLNGAGKHAGAPGNVGTPSRAAPGMAQPSYRMGQHGAIVLDVARRSVVAGAKLSLLVLAIEFDSCVSIDLDSGAFVRARGAGVSALKVRPYDVVSAQLALDEDPPDPASPEGVTLGGSARPVGRLRRRRAERYVRQLLAPPGPALLGFVGSSIPYWDLSGAGPSVALLELERGIQVVAKHDPHPVWARFQQAEILHNLPVTDPRLLAALSDGQRPYLSGDALDRALGFFPQYLLVTLTPPLGGRCYKAVAAALPRP
jgi:hypothetical protein